MKLYDQRWYIDIQDKEDKKDKKNKENNKIYKLNREQSYKNYCIYKSDGNMVENDIFLSSLQRYKKHKCEYKIDYKKFSKDNFLFKTKESVNKYQIISQKKIILKKKKITRKFVEEELNRVKDIDNDATDFIFDDVRVIITDSIEKVKPDKKTMYIIVEENNDEIIELKKNTINILKNINSYLYNLLTECINNKSNRYYLAKAKDIIENSDNTQKLLEEIKKLKNSDRGTLSFSVNAKKQSDYQEFFINAIISYAYEDCQVLTKEDVSFYLLGQIKHFSIYHRVESNVDFSKRNSIPAINSYIKNDKHTKKGTDTRRNVVKNAIDIDGFDVRFSKVYDEFNVEVLDDQIKECYDNDMNEDTYPFQVLKNHYNETFKGKDFNDEDNHLYKYIYKYLKGRVNKCVVRRKYISFNNEHTKEKTKEYIKQFYFETILYEGKKEVYESQYKFTENENVSNKFQEIHGLEELELELLGLITTCNSYLNEIFKVGSSSSDFFGSSVHKNLTLRDDIYKVNLDILDKLNLVEDGNVSESNFNTFISRINRFRNRIVHFDFTKNIYDKNDEVSNVVDNLNVLKNEYCDNSEMISKNNNLKTIYSDGIIISNINALDVDVESVNYNYPKFSKLHKVLSKKFYDNNQFSNLSQSNIETIKKAFIYVNKILYIKMLKYNNSDFIINEFNSSIITKNKQSKDSIKDLYSYAQKRASKGNKNAIKKLENDILDQYVSWLEERYKEIFIFSDLQHINDEEFESRISMNQNSEYSNYILNELPLPEFKIESEFDYVLVYCCLLNDNNITSRIKNRLISTKQWMEGIKSTVNDMNFDNSINNLEIILKVKNIDNIFVKQKIDNIILEELEEQKKMYEKNSFINFLSQEGEDKEFIDELENRTIVNTDNIEYFQDNVREIRDIINKERGSNRICYKLNYKKDNLYKDYDKYLDAYYKKQRLQTNSLVLRNYNNTMTEIINDDQGKFQEIYYVVEKNGNKKVVFNKHIFKLINNKNFKEIFEQFQKDDIEKLTKEDTDLYLKGCSEIISKVDEYIANIGTKLKGYSKSYKERYIDDIKNDKIKPNDIYDQYEDFITDYSIVCRYRKIRATLTFEKVDLVQTYLDDIAWKLLILQYRCERDRHQFIRGLKQLGKITYESDEEITKSEPILYTNEKGIFYRVNEDELYKYNQYMKFFYGFTQGSKKDKEEKDLRNSIAHLDIIKFPFTKKLNEYISEMDEQLKYRTKYRNNVYQIVFDVFKKQYNIDYNNIKTIYKSNKINLNDIIDPKRVSILKLESYYSVETIEKLIEHKKD